LTVIQPPLFGTGQTGNTSDDVFTPSWIFEQLGLTFDIDVASPATPVPYIPARRHYTKADDGLAQPWTGRVWMNPPYSECTPWVNRFLEHGDGIALLPCAKSNWFFRLWNEVDAMHVPVVFKFANSVKIAYPVFFAAMGEQCVEALGNLGRVR